MKKTHTNEKGYSLLEMIVAIAMFATIFLMVTSIYMSLLKSQRSVIATQTIQESMKFVLELISKEMRTAVKSNDSCAGVLGLLSDDGLGLENKVYNTDSSSFASGEALYFKNSGGKCVAYYLNGDRLMINRDGVVLPVTPNELSLSNLDFSVVDDDVGAFHSTQPTVTVKIDISYVGSKNLHNQATTLQTSITSRYYE